MGHDDTEMSFLASTGSFIAHYCFDRSIISKVSSDAVRIQRGQAGIENDQITDIYFIYKQI